ncbi:MAG: S-layer homology domain-containing protein, partial [Clostridia bacterium]|nr:S-layer homology domain-containing protein [Clostridia bacterium]
MKRIFSMIFAVMLIFAVASGTASANTGEESTIAANKISFSDVNENTPGYKAITKLVNAGIIHGYGDGTFKPNNFLTRAELVQMVNLVFGYTEAAEANFSDVTKDHWYYNQALVAKKAGYIFGYEDGSFGGQRSLTREQVCAVINRCANLKTLNVNITITDKVSDWAVNDVKKVIANVLMPLEENNTFRATENITRGELAQVLAFFAKDVTSETTQPTTPTTDESKP